MSRAAAAERAGYAAESVIARHNITSLPVDPVAIAASNGIDVQPMPINAKGVSGMLLRVGDRFGIAYATHVDSPGFRNFSIAHELGHYFLDGHVDAVLGTRSRHESRAGFSDDPYELEADQFAASLLMPKSLFIPAVARAGRGIAAVEYLAGLCGTSMTATAIRLAQHTGDVVAAVFSAGKRVSFSVMSPALCEIAGSNRIDKGDLLPPGTPTSDFNLDPNRVARAERASGLSVLQDWIGGRHQVELDEEVVGLGGYGRTLTVLTARTVVDLEQLEEDANTEESWRPRFRR